MKIYLKFYKFMNKDFDIEIQEKSKFCCSALENNIHNFPQFIITELNYCPYCGIKIEKEFIN